MPPNLFFFVTAPTENSTLSLHDALPIFGAHRLKLGPQHVDGLGKRHGDEYTSVPRADRACYSPAAALGGGRPSRHDGSSAAGTHTVAKAQHPAGLREWLDPRA